MQRGRGSRRGRRGCRRLVELRVGLRGCGSFNMRGLSIGEEVDCEEMNVVE